MKKIIDGTTLIESVNAMQTHAIGCMISAIIRSVTDKEYVDPELKNVISEMGEFADDLFKYIVGLNSRFNESFSDPEKGVTIMKESISQFVFLEDKGFRLGRSENGDRFLLIPLWLLYFLPDHYNLLKFSVTFTYNTYSMIIDKNKHGIIIDSYEDIERKDIDIESFYVALPNYGIFLGKAQKEI